MWTLNKYCMVKELILVLEGFSICYSRPLGDTDREYLRLRGDGERE